MADQRGLTPVRRALPRARRRPPRALLVVAVVAAGVVLVLDAAGFVRQGPAASPAAVQVLDATQLRAAIEQERAGGLAPQDVIADVAIDSSRRTPPLDRECVPLGQCTVIGTLAGFTDAEGTVTVRAQDQSVPPPTDPTALRAPIALRLTGSGPIEFLGHVHLTPDGLAFGVPATLAATADAPAGEVIAVTGWLVGVEGFSCGPVPMPGPPVPAPFSCHVPEFLTERATMPVSRTGLSGMGSGFQLTEPSGSVEVQRGAYQQFAPQPSFDGVNDVPRLGTYLLRMVVDDALNCAHCRGWLAVGRLDARAAPASPAPSGYQPLVRSPGELEAALAGNRAGYVGQVVFVDGQILAGRAATCADPVPCSIGILQGTGEPVVATSYTVSQFVPGDDVPMQNVLALVVEPDGLEYLGFGAVPLPLAELADPLVTNGLPLQVHPVTAWLVGMGPVPCASFASAPPADTPFDTCGGSWLVAHGLRAAARPALRRGLLAGRATGSDPRAARRLRRVRAVPGVGARRRGVRAAPGHVSCPDGVEPARWPARADRLADRGAACAVNQDRRPRTGDRP